MTNYVSIPQSKNNDPNYRYKMPQMRLSQESRLNGVKTNIKNLPDVARALRVPESAILKYFCAEVGANSEGTTIVKGQHTLADLERHLDKFIMKWVCCKKCKIPEITHEVKKKALIGICRSCGATDTNMDTLHKAGKQLHKDIVNFYQANHDIDPSNTGAAAASAATSAAVAAAGNAGGAGIAKSKKKKKKGGAAAEEEEFKEADADRVAAIIAKGGDVSGLDSVALDLNDESIVNACEELKIIVDEQAETGNIDVQKILSEVRQLQLQLNVTPEYKMYMAMCAIFGPHRNIVKHWDSFEALFQTLVEQDGEGGQKHLLQTLVQFFVNRYPDQQKFAAALCTKLYNNSIIEDQLFISWHGKKAKLDRHSKLHDLSAGKTMRGLLQEFVDWLQSAEYDDETGYGDETGAAAQEEEKKEEAPVETDAERNQRELIEAQKRAQAERAAAAKVAGDEKKKAAAAAAEEEAERQAAEDAANLEQIKDAKNVTQIQVEENFDIDDI